MVLFIKDEPFFEGEEDDGSGRKIRRVEARLQMAITEPDAPAPPQTPALIEFVLDTGADYAHVFPHHLRDAGITSPGPSGGAVPMMMADGSSAQGRIRDVSLWLYSNTGLEPYRIDPNGGVTVFPDPAGRNQNTKDLRALLGMNPLVDAGVKIELNAQTRRFSVWVPEAE